MKPAKSVLFLSVAGIMTAAIGFARMNEPTGKRMADAAEKLLANLGEELREQATFEFDDPERLNWHFIPRDRRGAVLKAMTPDQKDLVRNLLRAGLSNVGYDKALGVMALEAILREIEGTERARRIRDPELYYVSVFGKPGASGRWGWRVEGHHLSINYTLEDGIAIAETPLFFGANPAKVPEGPHRGLRTLPEEEDLARELYLSLDDEARQEATIADEAPSDILSGAQNSAPDELPLAGISVARLTDDQKDALRKLLRVYSDKHPSAIAEKLMEQVDEGGFNNVRFGWYGPSEPGKPHAYRIQGPTFIVEYNNTQNDANHVHAVWRNYSGEFGLARAE